MPLYGAYDSGKQYTGSVIAKDKASARRKLLKLFGKDCVATVRKLDPNKPPPEVDPESGSSG